MVEETKKEDMLKEMAGKKMPKMLQMLGLTPDIMAQVYEIFEMQKKKLSNCETMLIALCKKQGIEFE